MYGHRSRSVVADIVEIWRNLSAKRRPAAPMYFLLHRLQKMAYMTLRLVHVNLSLTVYLPLGNVTVGVRSTYAHV